MNMYCATGAFVKVATTKAQRKLFFNLRKARTRLGLMSEEEISTIANDLGVTSENVREMETRLNARDAAFDPYTNDSDDDVAVAPAAFLSDHRPDPAKELEDNQWQAQNQQQLRDALSQLDARSLDILNSRWLMDKKATLHELADKYEVSAERILQLAANAIKKLKKAMAS